MKIKLARVIAMLVLAVFTAYLIPHEFVHVFYSHEDTEHTELHGSGTSFSEMHIHCDFLSTDITDFTSPEEISAAVSEHVVAFHYPAPEVQTLKVVASLRDSRGPPALS